MPDADALILKGETVGAYPVNVSFEKMTTESGLSVDHRAIRADYAAASGRQAQVLGVVGDRYQATTPDEWRDLIRAAVKAGAEPTGAFSLKGGSRVLATFNVGTANGLRTNLCLADSFDGSIRLLGGMTSIRVVCANTLTAALNDSSEWSKIRHTSSLSEKVKLLEKSIGNAIEQGETIRQAFEEASKIKLSRNEATEIFNRLFPEADKDASKMAQTKAQNERSEALRAMANPINNVGDTLATLWNASTFLVDRTVNGAPRACRGGADRLDSLLFGARAKRLTEINGIIADALTLGAFAPVPVSPSSPIFA